MSDTKTNGRPAVQEAMAAIVEDRAAREKACMAELDEALKAIGEKHGCAIGAMPVIQQGIIVAKIGVQAK